MARQTAVLTVAAILILVGFSRRAAGQETRAPAITLRVYSYASIPADVMRAAREKVIRIYQEAGVDIDWVEPLANPTHTLTAPSATPSARFAVRMMIRPKMVSEARTPGSVM